MNAIIVCQSNNHIEICAINFVGLFPIPGRWIGTCYIITNADYITKWYEFDLMKTCSSEVASKFIYENIVIRFGCPLTLVSDQGTHFVNKTIKLMVNELMIDQHKRISNYPQSNGVIIII